jgi:nucleoside-diphosphate-sugar epimerase
MKKKKILITGSEGFIGKSFCNQFKSKYIFYRLDNFSRHQNKNFDKNRAINGSVFNKVILKKILKKVDIVVHMAAINGTINFYRRPKDVFETSFRGILTLYDAIKETNFKGKVLIASSGEVYGYPKKIPTDETSDMIVHDITNNRYSYGGGKICQDLLARYMIKPIVNSCIIFRPHNVYGPNMGYDHVIPELFLKCKKNNRQLKIQGSGKETRSFCYIEDFNNGLDILINKKLNGFHVFNIGSDEETSINSLLNKIRKLTKNKKKILRGKLHKWSVKRRKPDLTKIKNLGYKTKNSLDKGLRFVFLEDDKIKSLFSVGEEG